jgi:TolA-binding protein
MRISLFVLFALLLVGLGAPACGPRARGADTLTESVRSFNDGVRWERFAMAAARIPAPERSQFVEEMDERAEDLKITDYEIVRVDTRGPREARVQVKLSWYRTSEGTLRETHAMQTWERSGDAWMMVAEARVRGTEMPGLPEPVDREPSLGMGRSPTQPGSR